LALYLAHLADYIEYTGTIPEISYDSLKTLLTISSSSMLVIAVFVVGSMVAAYAAASNAATPRSFSLVVADDVSQNALATFIGAYIFSIIALIALMNGYYQVAGRFVLFLLTSFVFVTVILGFVRWVDRIARLGRMGNTIDKVEAATAKALRTRAQQPTLGAVKAGVVADGLAVYSDTVGYVQSVDLAGLQMIAEQNEFHITVAAPPGVFVSAGQPLAYVGSRQKTQDDPDLGRIIDFFVIGGDRIFQEDPRFGLVVLSEIASRALSPAVNDSGSAIDIIGTLVRLFTLWADLYEPVDDKSIKFDRVHMPELLLNDMFDDAFNAMSRDGASVLEVGIRLQKGLYSLSLLDSPQIKEAAIEHAQFALCYAEKCLKLPKELELIRSVASWVDLPSDE